jgi:hypothetical protein
MPRNAAGAVARYADGNGWRPFHVERSMWGDERSDPNNNRRRSAGALPPQFHPRCQPRRMTARHPDSTACHRLEVAAAPAVNLRPMIIRTQCRARLAASVVALGISAPLFSGTLQDKQQHATPAALMQSVVLQVSACFALLDAIQLADWRAVRLPFFAAADVPGAQRVNFLLRIQACTQFRLAIGR